MPETMAEVFGALNRIGIIPLPLAERLAGAIGFRNVAVHAYEAVNWKIVFAIFATSVSSRAELPQLR